MCCEQMHEEGASLPVTPCCSIEFSAYWPGTNIVYQNQEIRIKIIMCEKMHKESQFCAKQLSRTTDFFRLSQVLDSFCSYSILPARRFVTALTELNGKQGQDSTTNAESLRTVSLTKEL